MYQQSGLQYELSCTSEIRKRASRKPGCDWPGNKKIGSRYIDVCVAYSRTHPLFSSNIRNPTWIIYHICFYSTVLYPGGCLVLCPNTLSIVLTRTQVNCRFIFVCQIPAPIWQSGIALLLSTSTAPQDKSRRRWFSSLRSLRPSALSPPQLAPLYSLRKVRRQLCGPGVCLTFLYSVLRSMSEWERLHTSDRSRPTCSSVNPLDHSLPL